MGAGDISAGVKLPGRVVDHSPPSSAEVNEVNVSNPCTPSSRGEGQRSPEMLAVCCWRRPGLLDTGRRIQGPPPKDR